MSALTLRSRAKNFAITTLPAALVTFFSPYAETPPGYVPIGNYLLHQDVVNDLIRDGYVPRLEKHGITQEKILSVISRGYDKFAHKGERLLEDRPRFKIFNDHFLARLRLEFQAAGTPLTAENFPAERYLDALRGAKLADPKGLQSRKVHNSAADPAIWRKQGPELVFPSTIRRMVASAVAARIGNLRDAIFKSNIPDKSDLIVDKEAIKFAEDGSMPATVAAARWEAVDRIVNARNDEVHTLVGRDSGEVIKDAWDNIREVNFVKNEFSGKFEPVFTLKGGALATLKDQSHFKGFTGKVEKHTSIFFESNDQFIECAFVNGKYIVVRGKGAESEIFDLEDAARIVTAMNTTTGAKDLVGANQNLIDVMDGTIKVKAFDWVKDEVTEMTLSEYARRGIRMTAPGGKTEIVERVNPLVKVRHAGIHIEDRAVLDRRTLQPMKRHILDSVLTSLAYGINRLRDPEQNGFQASTDGVRYVVAPKSNNTAEIEYVGDVNKFSDTELWSNPGQKLSSLNVMIEEFPFMLQNTTAFNLIWYILSFGNNGFLDYNAAIIAAIFEAGPVESEDEMKKMLHMKGYDNVTISRILGTTPTDTGVPEMTAGAGMATVITDAHDITVNKIKQILAGFLNGWDAMPALAIIDAFMNHGRVNAHEVQKARLAQGHANDDYREQALKAAVIIPVTTCEKLLSDPVKLQKELDTYTYMLFSYFNPWIKEKIGCSGIPVDETDFRKMSSMEVVKFVVKIVKRVMEDLATARFKAAIIANRMGHDVWTPEQVIDSMKEMAIKANKLNGGKGKSWVDIDVNNIEKDQTFKAVWELLFNWDGQDIGYTEKVLQRHSLMFQRDIPQEPLFPPQHRLGNYVRKALRADQLPALRPAA